jgi:hypothetical protein
MATTSVTAVGAARPVDFGALTGRVASRGLPPLMGLLLVAPLVMLLVNSWTVGLITFLSAIYDISTPVLLYNASSRPLSILMLEYSFAGARERGAAIGVLLTAADLLILLCARSLGYRLSRDRL